MIKYRICLRRITPDSGIAGLATHDVEAEGRAEIRECAERMARETGRGEGEIWEVAAISEIDGAIVPMPANDSIEDDVRLTMSMPTAAWEGLLRAAQAGIEQIGVEDRDAFAGYAILKGSVAKMGRDMRPAMGCPREERR